MRNVTDLYVALFYFYNKGNADERKYNDLIAYPNKVVFKALETLNPNNLGWGFCLTFGCW